MTSEGVHTNKLENWIEQQSSINKSFNPIVWREVDRDGFTDIQKVAIEKKYETKCPGSKKYMYSMLPVNEIENFLIINTDIISDEDFESIKDDIKDAFCNTVANNLNVCNKYVSDDKFIV